jgi:hypothetical protein
MRASQAKLLAPQVYVLKSIDVAEPVNMTEAALVFLVLVKLTIRGMFMSIVIAASLMPALSATVVLLIAAFTIVVSITPMAVVHRVIPVVTLPGVVERTVMTTVITAIEAIMEAFGGTAVSETIPRDSGAS